MRILLTEGSGLTSRQVATRLGELGHAVEVLSSTGICISRFTRHVARIHRVPPFGKSPLAWLDAARAVAAHRRIDVVFPTQEQVAVLAAFPDRIGVPTIVPPFSALRRVQDKHTAYFTLAALGIPQPSTVFARTEADLASIVRFPVFVKKPVSTASSGVRRADDAKELAAAARALGLGAAGVLVQERVEGALAMVQAVADEGRLIAWHANLRVREGASGGAAAKKSIHEPAIGEHLATLVGGLRWRGPISLDAVLTDDAGPMYIDVNPRLVEPRNAWLSGVDLVQKTLALAGGGHPRKSEPGRAGVLTHQLLLGILGAAEKGRRAVARELMNAALGRDGYRDSVEELTPLGRDPLAAVPVAAAAAATLVWPRARRWFIDTSVGGYALTPEGWIEILRTVPQAH
jgi:hypothetical protein